MEGASLVEGKWGGGSDPSSSMLCCARVVAL